jgi:hypothetical protein
LVIPFDPTHWWTMQGLVNGRLGFTSLQHVKIVFPWHNSEFHRDYFVCSFKREDIDIHAFPCTGAIALDDAPDETDLDRAIDAQPGQVEILVYLKQVITFAE